MHNQYFSVQRILYIISSIVISFVACIIMISQSEVLLDEKICIFVVAGMIFLLLVLEIVGQRLHGTKIYRSSNYRNLLVFLTIHWIYLILISNVQVIYAPLFLLPFFLLPFSSIEFTSLITVFDVMLLAIVQGNPLSFSFLYSILVLSAIVICQLMNFYSGKTRIPLYIVSFCIAFLIPCLYRYMIYHELDLEAILIMLGISSFELIFIVLIFPFFEKISTFEKIASYEQIMDEKFSLREEIRLFSKFEYAHALKVSKCAKQAAILLECDANACEAGGFYYRLSKIYGEDSTEDAMKAMENACFPKEVMQIVYERKGENVRPTTQESAIVHMVDHVVTRMEVLGGNTLESTWNKDMVVYQALNTLSQSGIYDVSGLSMNQYLKVRDFLVQEDLLR